MRQYRLLTHPPPTYQCTLLRPSDAGSDTLRRFLDVVLVQSNPVFAPSTPTWRPWVTLFGAPRSSVVARVREGPKPQIRPPQVRILSPRHNFGMNVYDIDPGGSHAHVIFPLRARFSGLWANRAAPRRTSLFTCLVHEVTQRHQVGEQGQLSATALWCIHFGETRPLPRAPRGVQYGRPVARSRGVASFARSGIGGRGAMFARFLFPLLHESVTPPRCMYQPRRAPSTRSQGGQRRGRALCGRREVSEDSKFKVF